ncbi:apical junction component 1 homolog [Leucoraja erinacea]|uniref:apical junction component 1 homolog n=1 Tax=Leucoraja erinaceus TaxID=7782 RepID=UPI002453A1E7|nr:apical junction component 1 homolog [Leucoraja erinacea]
MTRTDPPDILVSTVYREIRVSPMPGEPKTYRAQPGSARRDAGKRHCRSFDRVQSPESQGPAERGVASPDLAWDSLGRQVYVRSSAPDLVSSRLGPAAVTDPRDAARPEGRKRGRSKSAPRVKTTYRPVPVELGSPEPEPEPERRGREAVRRVDGSPRRLPSRGRMDDVHPIKLQPQRADAGFYPHPPPLSVSDLVEPCTEAPGPRSAAVTAGVHVRYRMDMRPPEEVAPPGPRAWRVAPGPTEPGRCLTVPSSRRPHWTRSPGLSQAGEYWTLATHGCSPQMCRGRAFAQTLPGPDARSHSRALGDSSPWRRARASPMHYHDWWGPQPAPWAPLSPHGSLATARRHHSRSWDDMLSPGRQPERGHDCRSYETLPLLERGRRQPTVVNLSRSPQRYAALSLSEGSLLERLQGEGGAGPGRSWYLTPEITITDNDLRAGGEAAATRAGGRQPADGANGLSASFNDLLSCQGEAGGSPGSGPGKQQLDDVLADLVIDTCKTPAPRGPTTGPEPAHSLLEQLRKLIGGDDLTGELLGPEAEPRLAANRPLSPTYPSPCGVSPPERCSDELDTMLCSNPRCGLAESLFHARLYFKSCHSCFTYYCSRGCRKDDWEAHKEACVYGRVASACKRLLRCCREDPASHRAFSRIARMGYLSRGRGVLFLGFPNPGAADSFVDRGLSSLSLAPTYLSLRELQGYAPHLGRYLAEVRDAGAAYNPDECFLLNVSVALGQKAPEQPEPRLQTPTVRRFAKIALASGSPDGKAPAPRDDEMETLILTPPPGTADMAQAGEEGRKAREVCFINVQRELRLRGVFLRHEYPHVYHDLCRFVENNERFTPTTIYPVDKRSGRQFMCMIMAASEPLTLDWVRGPNVLDDMM